MFGILLMLLQQEIIKKKTTNQPKSTTLLLQPALYHTLNSVAKQSTIKDSEFLRSAGWALLRAEGSFKNCLQQNLSFAAVAGLCCY